MNDTAMKKTILGILFLCTGVSTWAQNQTHWTSVLNNDRENAMQQVSSACSSDPSIENLISKEIIRNETGKSNVASDFLSKAFQDENWEYYLYAFWKRGFFFGDYLSDGFNNRRIDLVNTVYQKPIKNRTLREGVNYMKAISSRHLANYADYRRYTGMMTGIQEWQFCGVFENLNNSGIDAVYPPEEMAYSSEDFNANSNGFVNWYNAEASQDGYMHFTAHSEYGSGVHYAQTFISNNQEREVYLRIGSSSKFKVWLNDVLIYEGIRDVETDLDAYNIKLNLPVGDSRLLFKFAEPSSSTYFIARITDENGIALDDLSYSRAVKNYKAATAEQLNAQYLDTEFERFFKEKVASDPENFFYNYCLIETYLRNGRYEPAKELAMKWYTKYPKSSMMRMMMIELYSYEDSDEEIDELRENIEFEDKDYYFSMLLKFKDVQELFRMSTSEMNDFLDEFSDMMDNEVVTNTCGLLKSLRVENRAQSKIYLDKLVSSSLAAGELGSLRRFVPLYESLLEDEAKKNKYIKKLNKEYFDFDLRMQLARYYAEMNNRPKVIAIFKELHDNFQEYGIRNRIAYLYQEFGMFPESEKYVDEMLKVFPYSFNMLESKGDVLLQTGRMDEAIEYYNKSLVHNSSNSSLRRKIRDIQNTPDIVEDYRIEDVYAFIEEKRDKIKDNNYGYNILLEEEIVLLYDEAGGKRRHTYVYEVTSSQGVETLTEYNLGYYSGFDLIKAEIIKANGSIVPAETNYSNFVFNGLEVGDVVHIDYETYFNGYGRFYKDFVSSVCLDSYSPTVRSNYTYIIPNAIDMKYVVTNGGDEPKVETTDKHKIYSWRKLDIEPKPLREDYMPKLVDVFAYAHLSSIESWTDVAFWYSDLVRSQMDLTSEVTDVFKELFPEEDLSSVSEEEKAERIYNYLMDNFNYSYVSFKQSGYVPQAPGKTIKTKLGDCKDFSTLYVTLARLAELKANLVLVLTAENGKQDLMLPSQDFNHCIVRVTIDGEERFLELTDKNLPFKALPRSLRGATILEIPYKYSTSDTYELELIEDPKRQRNVHDYTVHMLIDDNSKEVEVRADIYGASRSYYRSELEEPNYNVLKERVYEIYDRMYEEHMKVDSVFAIEIDKRKDSLSYTTKMTVKEKSKKIGGIKIIELPAVSDAYNGNIVEKDERKYPINYLAYEGLDEYKTTYVLELKEGNFAELPENISLTYKGHSYERTYTQLAPNKLEVKVVAKPDWKNISVEEYEAFKEYVTQVLESKDVFIGYQ